MQIYIDTSVFGGYFDDEFEIWSRQLFKDFKNGKKTAVISDLTIRELENSPVFVRELLSIIPDKYKEFISVDEETIHLADLYIKEKIVPPKSFNDTVHIALATINKIDILVSWNFKHIVNLNRIRLYNAVNLKYGYMPVEIRSPREIVDVNFK